jgi:beta-lactam-binding protein with PASTA domain
VPLNAGANTITAIAKDASGQASQAQVSVTYSPPAAPSCTVPKVTGLSQAAAATAIGNAGCTVGVTTQVPSKVAKGNVATQSRAAGSKLPAYFPIDLKISSGPVGKAKLVTKSVTVKNGRITVQISCPKTSGNACNGTAKIRTRTKLGGARRTLGTKAFQAPAGKKRKTTFVLSKTNARRIKGHTVKTQVFIVYRDEDGKSRTTKANLTIKG